MQKQLPDFRDLFDPQPKAQASRKGPRVTVTCAFGCGSNEPRVPGSCCCTCTEDHNVQTIASPPEFSEPLPESPEQGVRMWLDLMECAEQLLLAGLAREADSEEDLKARYRAWYAQVMEEHDEAIFRMMRRFEVLNPEYSGER